MGAMPAYRFEVIASRKRDSAREYFFELESKLMSEETQRKSIGEVEEELYSGIMELGRRLIQEHIDARGDGHVGEAIVRGDGKRLSHKRPGTRHLESLFGEVEVERVGYSARGEASVFPKDSQMSLPEQVYSYPVQQKVCREAIRCAYDEIDETLSEYTGAHVPKRQSLEIVKQAAEDFDAFYQERSSQAGAQVRDQRAEYVPAQVQFQFRSQAQGIDVAGDILVQTGDGKGIPMREEGLREPTRKRAVSQKRSNRRSKGEKKHRKREAMVASVYTIKPYIRTVDDIMADFFGDKTRASSSPPRPENKRVWASLSKDKAKVFEEMADAGQHRRSGVRLSAFLCDGANILQDLAKKVLKPQFDGTAIKFVIILDLLHVLGYLWKAALAFFSEGDRQAEEWVGKYVRMILEGKASIVAGVLRRMATQHNLQGSKREAVDKAADYFLNNKEYMHYESYLELGLPIASGVIEGTCKHLVKDRFEISGARWGLGGAEALLKLRSIYQSGDWQDYWKFHIAREQERVRPQKQWEPVDEPKVPKLTVIQGGKSSKK
jgi:hypothetical protein